MTVPAAPVGYLAAGLVYATFCAKRMVPLRTLAIASNLAFMAYGYLDALWPILILHSTLLPLNVLRLIQANGRPASRPDHRRTASTRRARQMRRSLAKAGVRAFGYMIVPANGSNSRDQLNKHPIPSMKANALRAARHQGATMRPTPREHRLVADCGSHYDMHKHLSLRVGAPTNAEDCLIFLRQNSGFMLVVENGKSEAIRRGSLMPMEAR